MRIGVNGFGRIGRCVLRAIFEEKYTDVSYIQINAFLKIEELLHLLQFDSTHGRFVCDVKIESEQRFFINNIPVNIISQRNIENIKWDNIDVVMECTGKFKSINELKFHLQNGAKGVVLSCPASDKEIPTIVFGANEQSFKKGDNIVSIGSCTTNALAPIAKLIHDNFEIVSGFVTTVHAYTNDQNILDGKHKDPRRARSCTVSMIPTSTGAAKTMHLVIPSLKGKLNGSAIRVPTQNVSLIDCSFIIKTNLDVDVKRVNNLIESAAKKSVCNALSFTDKPLVSIDLNHNNASTVVDLLETKIVGNLLRILSWYDNEWAFSVRMLDMAMLIAK